MTVSADHEVELKTLEAPVSDAFEAMLNLEVPKVAREFFKRATGAGEKLAANGRNIAENATATIEEAGVRSIREAGKVSRAVQTALFQDADALLAGLGKLATAASPTDALQISSDFIRDRSEIAAERVKAIVDYVGGAASNLRVSAH